MGAIGKTDLRRAASLALAGDWEGAHEIVQQDETDSIACWIHAVVHKIEGDEANSRYWYARTKHSFEDYKDAKAELAVIATTLK
ncbi:MAG TPA: hypothetical protein VNH64_00725 [Parvularculaceae bacterium]|nr:hypothetical protein [Parvularculaceae bacterium]